ncbi:hypothetical protein CCP2SC5_440011 [Azospirillaceae bacterium]
MTIRFGIGGKLSLVFALFLIPIIFLLYSLVEEKQIAIDFARKELVGSQYIAVTRDLRFALQDALEAPPTRERTSSRLKPWPGWSISRRSWVRGWTAPAWRKSSIDRGGCLWEEKAAPSVKLILLSF